MLLTVDIGNTNITLGVFEGKKLHVTFRMTTIQTRTSDEYGMVMCELLEHNDVKVEEITDVIVASVVPNVMHSLTSAIIKYFHTKPIIIEAGVKTGIRVASKNPRQVGADRIVDAAAVYELYGGPAIVIDYGTATTFDLVDADGTFTACVIAPGIRTSAQAMWSMAAKLPEFEIKKPKSILAQDTIACMQAGLGIWTDRTDRIHCQTDEERVWQRRISKSWQPADLAELSRKRPMPLIFTIRCLPCRACA